jgi:lipopolysaccharide export system protein LptC
MKRPSLRLFWDRLSVYLPILLMGLFAMVTFWLIRSTPSVIEATAGKPLKHEADYFLRNFSVKAFDVQGKLKSEVVGREARHFPDTDTLEIEQVRMRTIGENGLPTIATANRAISDATGDDVQLFGNVHVSRQLPAGTSAASREPVEYRSEYLHVKSDDGKVVTHLPVVISQGKDRFSGDAMTYDDHGSVIELTGRVRGVLTPRKAP